MARGATYRGTVAGKMCGLSTAILSTLPLGAATHGEFYFLTIPACSFVPYCRSIFDIPSDGTKQVRGCQHASRSWSCYRSAERSSQSEKLGVVIAPIRLPIEVFKSPLREEGKMWTPEETTNSRVKLRRDFPFGLLYKYLPLD